MKKIKWYLLSILMVVSVGIFSSCSNDDTKESSVKSSLIGAWTTSIDNSNWKTIKINSGGKMIYDYLTKANLEKYTYNPKSGTYYYTWIDKDGNSYGIVYDPRDNANWTFDEDTQTILMYTENGYYSYKYKVIMNEDKNSWVGIDEANNRTYTFTRINE